jgi:hypothetical protein
VNSDQWLEHAARLAESLENQAWNTGATEWMANYYHMVGDIDKAETLTAGIGQLAYCNCVPEWAGMFEEGRTQDLEHKMREDDKNVWTKVNMGVLLAVTSDEGRREARRIYEQLSRQDLPLSGKVIILDILLLLGDFEGAQRAAQAISSAQWSTQWRWYHYLADYHSGNLSEEDLLAQAKPFGGSLCVAYYAIALRSFSQGDLDKAKEYFSKTRETPRVTWAAYHWGKAFAKRMEQDQTFGSWKTVEK